MTVLDQFRLVGRTALVTGGSGWLGTAFAESLAEAGATVVISSRNVERARSTASALPAPDGQSHGGVCLELTDAESIQHGFQAALDEFSSVQILVNNGLEAVGQDLVDITLDQFTHHQANNAGYFELARQVRDHAVQHRQSASIINIGSMYGQVGSYPDAYDGVCSASSVAYHALKGGTIQMTRHLAVYWARDNVRVNCLSPGPFPNPASAPAELIRRLEKKTPLGRMGTPAELKGAILFLASDASGYMTGQNLTIDGGWTAW